MKSLTSQDSGIHHLHFTASDTPLQSFSDISLKISHHHIYRAYNPAIVYDRQTAGKAYNQYHIQLATLSLKFMHINITREQCPTTHLPTLPTSLICSECKIGDFRNRKPVWTFSENKKTVLQMEPSFGNPNFRKRLIMTSVCTCCTNMLYILMTCKILY